MTLNGEPHGRDWKAFAAVSGDPATSGNSADLGAKPGARGATVRTQWGTTIEDTGIRAGEIIGYRAWMLTDRGRLSSMFACYEWTPGAVEKADNKFPWLGLHAFKTLRQAKAAYRCYTSNGTVVFGSVAMWGEVIEHERGYRAEYAAVHSIIKLSDFGGNWWRPWKWHRRARLRKLYAFALPPHQGGGAV